MALHTLVPLPNCGLLKMLPPPQSKSPVFRVQRNPSTSSTSVLVSTENKVIFRPSANYQPSTWHCEYIQSVTSEFGKESYVEERDELKAQVRMVISQLTDDSDKLEFIDVMQKLGLFGHFVHEITNLLQHVYTERHTLKIGKRGLHATALEFRLLRQHGYDVSSSEVFKSFQDDQGRFEMDDIKGMLSLYEASFQSMEGETVLDEAREFCRNYLKEHVEEDEEVRHALELPLHWRIPRLEAQWFIDLHERRKNVSPALLQLARLDFNIAQVTHQQDLKYTSRWWKEIGLVEKLSFARDMPMENFFWGVGMASQPELSYFRSEMTKITSLITIIDDIYDVYGSLEELELFTQVVQRWDVNALDILPSYMKICFIALYNSVNEVAFAFLKDTDHNIIPYLKKAWGDLCKSYMIEAKWYYNGYVPRLEEYMENAWISVGGPVALVQGYFLINNITSPHHLHHHYLEQDEYPNLIRLSSTLVRLANDLASYRMMNGDVSISKCGDDVPKSIACYITHSGASQQEAYQHLYSLMCQTWKKLNEAAHNSAFPPSFTQIALNLARMAQYMYQHGDGHAHDPHTNHRMLSLLIHPHPKPT